MSLRLGFIGFGEAAFHIAQGLREEGFTTISAYDKFWNTEPYATQISRRVQESGVELLHNLPDLVRACDMIISATSGRVAAQVAQEAAPFLRPGKIFVDVNAASPKTMEDVSSIVEPTGARFVDVAMMGPLPVYKHRVPMLACGSGADGFRELLSPYKMRIQVVGRHPGMASAIKLFRSIFMKGIAAILIETLVASRRFQVESLIMDSIRETMEETSFANLVNRFVCGTAIHSDRRVHEMEDVIATLDSLGIDSGMSRATKEKLAWVNALRLKDTFGGETPSSYQEVLDAIDRASRPSENRRQEGRIGAPGRVEPWVGP
ncbi:MAG TPA: NAD(P)-dependent oxidoreductase [Firmicutes bacterium]|nr:NAD(P)-dependent oxidoreductase [Bacillota bacterium]